MKLFCKHLDKPLEFVQNITADETTPLMSFTITVQSCSV